MKAMSTPTSKQQRGGGGAQEVWHDDALCTLARARVFDFVFGAGLFP
jgi:hypothetical protein